MRSTHCQVFSLRNGFKLTWLEEMIRLFVPDTVFSSGVWPPWWSLGSTLGVWKMGLLLWLNKFDKSLTHDFATRLLHVLKANIVKLVDLSLVSYRQLLSLDDWNRGVVIVLGSMTLS
jgi:hypothetical protein